MSVATRSRARGSGENGGGGARETSGNRGRATSDNRSRAEVGGAGEGTSSARRTAPATHDKYEAILTAALHVFIERGFYGAAVPEVARRAGVAAGTIYTYFPSKEALVNTLFRKWKSALAQRVHTEFPVGASSRQQFDTMWWAMARFALENPEVFAFLELHNHRSYLDAESRALDNQLKDFAAVAVALGQGTGTFKKLDTTLLMELVFGAFHGMMRAHYDGRVKLTDETLEGARNACWDAIAEPAVPAPVDKGRL